MTYLQLDKVSKLYPQLGQTAGVKNISLAVNEGEIIGIVGESGSGKSTLLRLIAGLDDTDAGEIRLAGIKVAGRSQRLIAGHTAIKLVHQDFQLMPKHKVSENIGYYLRHLPKEDYETTIDQYLADFELEACTNQLPAQLSGGQQQRTALAVALAASPSLLLLDEPFSHLDMRLKQLLKSRLLPYLQENNITTLLVTHDIQDALALTNRIVVMQQGQILRIDTPENIYHQPQCTYIANLFGNTNIFPLDIVQEWFVPLTPTNLPPQVCIRAEDWLVHLTPPSTSHIVFKVTQRNFMGFYYEYKGFLATHTQLVSVISPIYLPHEIFYLQLTPQAIKPLYAIS